MDSSTASTTNGVYLPNFPLATGDLLRAIEHSGSVKQTSSDDAGEYYSMAMAKPEPAEQVMESAIIVIPLTVPRAGEVLHCAAYSADAPYRPVEVGAVFKFPSIASYIVASKELATAVRAKPFHRETGRSGETHGVGAIGPS
jgi:hypothetical protein